MSTRTVDLVISDLFAASEGGGGITHSKGWVAFMVPEKSILLKRLGLQVSRVREVLVFINEDIDAAVLDKTLRVGNKVTVTFVGNILEKGTILKVALESGRVIYDSYDSIE